MFQDPWAQIWWIRSEGPSCGHRGPAHRLLRALVVHKDTAGANLSEAASARRHGPNQPQMMEDPPGCIEEGFYGPNASHWAVTNVNQGHRTVGVEDRLQTPPGIEKSDLAMGLGGVVHTEFKEGQGRSQVWRDGRCATFSVAAAWRRAKVSRWKGSSDWMRANAWRGEDS